MADLKFKSKVQLQGGATLTAETASRALILDGSGNIKSSAVTDTELGYVSGVTSSIQTQLSSIATAISDHLADAVDAHDASAISNVPSGNLAATDVQAALNELQSDVDTRALDSAVIKKNGSVAFTADQSMGGFKLTNLAAPTADNDAARKKYVDDLIAALPDPMEYKGNWDASTNSPALVDGTGNNGDVYNVSVAGTQFTPAITFKVGDKVVYNGAAGKWEKWDIIDPVNTDEVPEGTTNLYFTDERAQDAVGTILTDTNTVDFTYNDAGNQITADVKTQMSITSDASGLKLSGDAASPGNTKYYGTNGSGVKGFYDIPATGTSAGDIFETSFSLSNNQTSAANVTGLAFAAATVRGFKALVTVEIDATLDLFETFELVGVNKGGTFDMAVSSAGDESGVVFSITSAGQVQYTSANYSGFVSGKIKFRAITTTVG